MTAKLYCAIERRIEPELRTRMYGFRNWKSNQREAQPCCPCRMEEAGLEGDEFHRAPFGGIRPRSHVPFEAFTFLGESALALATRRSYPVGICVSTCWSTDLTNTLPFSE
jgi:hypothetical protein